MSNKEENEAKFQEFRLFCKQIWNTRESPEIFINHIKEIYSKKDIETFFFNFIGTVRSRPIKLDLSVDDYILSIIADDPSVIFANIDLNNTALISDIQEIIKICKIDLFNVLPVNSKKSADTALNVLIISLMNDNKVEMKKSIQLIAQSTYFSILLSSGRLFCIEKYKQAQKLFKMNDPFDCPPFQLPVTQIHLVLALFPDFLMIPFHYHDKFKLSFFVFLIFQLLILDCSDIKLLITDSTLATAYSSFLNHFLVQPTYLLSYFLNTFPKKHFNSKNIIKVNDFYAIESDFSNYSLYYDSPSQSFCINTNLHKQSENNLEKILHFFYDTNSHNKKQDGFYDDNIIHDQLPNGILPTYEQALDFLLRKPESIDINTIIEDALHYPSFTPEIANIFMSSLKQKDYQTATTLAIQILDKIDDIKLAWIEQFVLFPIMNALYECLIEIYDDYQFEILFFLFISFYEGLTNQGDVDVMNALTKFISKMDEPFRLFLLNFLNHDDEIFICKYETDEEKPIKKLINFLYDCKMNNDINVVEMIKYPYLIFTAFIWGFKTIHPNSIKLLSIKLPKYKILNRFAVYLSSCHQNKKDPFIKGSSNLIYAIKTSYCSFDLFTRFPPMDESGIRIIIFQNLHQISNPKAKTKLFQGVIISWRAWITIFSIERFVVIIIETLIMESNGLFNQDEVRGYFLVAERLLANVFLSTSKTKICFSVDNQINFNTKTNQFENIYENFDLADFEKNNINIDDYLKSALWTALEFVNNYDGSYSDGIGIASFCLLLNVSIKNDWKSEFKKVLNFCNKMIKESDWKSLKYSFGANFLYISMAIIEVYELIDIEKYDLEFLQMNWKFGINFFFFQSEIKRLKELKLISLDN